MWCSDDDEPHKFIHATGGRTNHQPTYKWWSCPDVVLTVVVVFHILNILIHNCNLYSPISFIIGMYMGKRKKMNGCHDMSWKYSTQQTFGSGFINPLWNIIIYGTPSRCFFYCLLWATTTCCSIAFLSPQYGKRSLFLNKTLSLWIRENMITR